MRVFAERQPVLALVVVAMVVLEAAAGLTYLAVYDFDFVALGADPTALPARGAAVATLLRWGLIVDLLGYLALAPVVFYLHRRFTAAGSDTSGRPWVVDVVTFGGLGWVLAGSIGATLLASVGPTLIQASAAAGETAISARVAYAALANAVVVGLWGTLEWLLLGVWLIGVGWLVRGEDRAFAWLAAVAGVGGLAYGLRTGLTGRPPVDLTSPLDLITFGAFGLFFVWAIWLAIRLWQGR
jgi:hypothetical protein